MKKILLATSLLGLCSTAHAATVSGYAISAYDSANKHGVIGETVYGYDKSSAVYSEAEIEIKEEVETQFGLTFGGAVTMGFSGNHTAYTTKPYTYVKGYVSGGYGTFAMGRLPAAGRSVGATSLSVGVGVKENNHTLAYNRTDKGTIVYISPDIAGVKIAYSADIGHDYSKTDTTVKSGAIRYEHTFDGDISDVDFVIAGNVDIVTKSIIETSENAQYYFREKAIATQLAYQGFTLSYGVAESRASLATTSAKKYMSSDGKTGTIAERYLGMYSTALRDEKVMEKRIGGQYDMEDFTFGFAQGVKTSYEFQAGVKELSLQEVETRTETRFVQYRYDQDYMVYIEQFDILKSGYTESTLNSEEKILTIGAKIAF